MTFDRYPANPARIYVFIGTLAATSCALAHPTLDRDCVSCHPSYHDRFELVGFQKVLSGVQVYTVTQGANVAIGINITNGASQHATCFYISNPSGRTNTANKLSFQGDPAWKLRTNGGVHYMLPLSGGASTVAKEKLMLNLMIDPTVPPDIYRGFVEVAGINGVKAWGQEVDFLIEVQSAPNPQPLILSPALANGQFGCPLHTGAGITYVLEYKASLNDNSWTAIGGPLPGNGNTQSLIDPTPNDPVRFYRVRVQP